VDGLNNVAWVSYSLKDTGVIGSGVLGGNFRSGSFVCGVEADLGGVGFSSKTIGEPKASQHHVESSRSGFYGDVTGRLGFAAGSALFNARGGWAVFDGWANVDNTLGGLGVVVITTGFF
jgi:hypothetical protein